MTDGRAAARQRIGELRGALDAATQMLRTSTFVYLSVWAYVVVAAGSVTHEQMLRGHELVLPLLGTSVDLVSFFWIAPALFVIVHGNVLLNLYLVARRVRRFNHELAQARLSGLEEEHERALVPAFPFVEWRAGRHATRAMHGLLAMVGWIMYLVLPLAALLWIQFRWLPYQDIWATGFHVLLVLLDLAMLWTVWPRLGESGDWWPAIRAQFATRVRAATLVVAAVATLAVPLGSLALWLDQQPDEVPLVRHLNGFVPWKPYRFSRLTVRDLVVMQKEPPQAAVAAAVQSAKTYEEKEEAIARLYLDPALAAPIDLTKRRLRGANLDNIRMYGARLGEADLQGAVLEDARLQQAYFQDTRLQGAVLDFAQLKGAAFWKAQLQGASLRSAQLQNSFIFGSNLKDAVFDFARLWGAVLHGTSLEGAKLRGAVLVGAQLQGASLERAQLQGAVLMGLRVTFRVGAQGEDSRLVAAQRQGVDIVCPLPHEVVPVGAQVLHAVLAGAELQGASLKRAQLQGAVLMCPQLRGVYPGGAQLVGADLRGTRLFGVSANEWTDLSVADMRGAEATPMPENEMDALRKELYEIKLPQKLAREIEELVKGLRDSQKAQWQPTQPPPERRRHILVEDSDRKEDSLIQRWLGPGVSPTEYEPKVAETLAAIVCEGRHPPITQGIVRHRMSNWEDRERPYVRELAHRLTSQCPDAVRALDSDDRAFVEEASERWRKEPRAPEQPSR